MTPYRCDACGNKTRFDVFETRSVRAFHHQTLGGETTVEEEEVVTSVVHRVECRWCGAAVPHAAESESGDVWAPPRSLP
jgi:hypothetical protein